MMISNRKLKRCIDSSNIMTKCSIIQTQAHARVNKFARRMTVINKIRSKAVQDHTQRL